METFLHYIDGRLTEPHANQFLDVTNPALGEVYARVADGDAADIDAAVDAAEKAFPTWSKLPVRQRAQHLENLAKAIQRRLEDFAKAETRNTGKPLSASRTIDIPRAVKNFEFFAGAIQHDSSDFHATDHEALNYTLRQPLGVVGCISPWNLPLYLLTWKIAPALASGNCVVAKPSEIAPHTAFLLSKLCADIGFPAGVLNIVHGRGGWAGRALVEHPKVLAVSFTGGTKTGREIAQIAAPSFKKLSLELGGKNPVVIFADAQFDEMMNQTVRAAFANQGQICLCGSRIYIERPLYARFREAFVERAKKLRVGDPMDEQTDQGSLVSKTHFEKVMGAIAQAKRDGAKILCGGDRATVSGRCENGWFVQPTVLEGLPENCPTVQEEIFGPVVSIAPFDAEDEVLQWANGTAYGLAATVWTENLARAHRMAERLEAGIIWINCWMLRDLRTPFGGVKNSGVGREGGTEALRFFTEPKNVCVKLRSDE